MYETGDERIEEYGSLVQPDIAYCTTCQPYDGSEVVWIFGIRTNLEDLFDECEVPSKLRDALADSLHCLGCGTQLSRYDDVGLKTESELEADRKWDEWYEKYEWRVDEFREFLERYPYLGSHHELGKTIHSAIQGFPQATVEEESWWRARKVDSPRGVSIREMFPARFPEAEGRFSHYGQRALYLASTREAALKEVLNKDERLAWVIELKIRRVKKLLDLSDRSYWEEHDVPVLLLGLAHDKLSSMRPDKQRLWKPEYFVPRFIADCARHQRLRGIIFKSPRHYANNLVLFKWSKCTVVPVGKPSIMQLKNTSTSESRAKVP